MTMTAADLPHIRRSLLTFAALAALGATALFAALRYAAAAASADRAALAQRLELRAQLARTATDAAEIRVRSSRYRELAARGIFGPEHRPDWVERIAQIAAARRLADLRYEFAPQQPAPGDGMVMVSTMKLQLPLLHEDDLLGFLADLSASVSALPRVRACNVERSGARLRAECTIDWITLREQT